MKPDHWQQLESLFHSALGRGPAERAPFLDEACADDEALRKEVKELLAAHEDAGSFIESPALEVEARSLADHQDESAVGHAIGNYKVISVLGVGGMGEVYVAQDMQLGRRVALKLLPAEFSRHKDRVRRFQQEARAASALNHPNIITIYEIGQLDDRHFMATELIDGETLRGRTSGVESRSTENCSGKAGMRPQFQEILNIAIQAADALAAAHEAGIVHRDIKPENIMVRRRDGYVKVLDFGLAKLTEGPAIVVDPEGPTRTQIKTSAGVVMGTANYMSPEQARGEKVDGRTDIWSLGVVLYELVAGSAPFERSSPNEVIAVILEREPTPLATYAREVPPELERIVTKALTKDREERYQTANDLLVDLRRLRQRLEVEAGIEQLATLGARSEPTVATEGTPAVAESRNESAARSDVEVVSSTSTAEYLVTEIKRHKTVAVALATLIIAVAAITIALNKFIGKSRPGTKPTAAFHTMKIAKLTSTGKAAEAAISPDGKYVVHVVDDAGQQSLWIRQVATSSNVQIVAPADVVYRGLTFSRDGNYVYYVKWDKKTLAVLYQMPVLGGIARRLVVDIDSAITFSPDDRQFAFFRGGTDTGESALIIANINGSSERKVAVRKEPDFFPTFGSASPAWSLDGKVIECPDGRAGASGISMTVVEVNVADGAVKPITSQRWKRVQSLAWLRDGSGMVLTAKEQPFSPFQIWYLSYPGGEVHKITNDLSEYHGISLTIDSTALVTVQIDQVSNISIARTVDTNHATQLTSGKDDGNWGISWTPDGKIVYASRASGNMDIWIMHQDGSNQKQLTADAGANGWPTVSADGRYIVFASDRVGDFHLWRMNIDGSNSKQLTNGSGENWPVCSPDGQWVVYNSVWGNNFLWKVPIDGGEPVQVIERFSTIPAISPDGKLLASFTPIPGGLEGVAIYPFAGGQPIRSFEISFDKWTGVRWTPDGRALAYINSNKFANITSQPIDGSPSKHLTDFKDGRIFNFAWSRNGKWLALARGSVANDVVLISGFREE